MEMTWFTVGVLFLFFVVIGKFGSARRPADQASGARACRACMVDHPPFANYCRHCGRQL